jgi:predicted TIM-barrel fold metal-dependent hydrolase
MNLTTSKNWVDTHFHVFHAGVAFHGARYVPHYTAALQDWLVLAQGVGVTRGVCVQPSFLGTDNRLMVSALEKHPNLLRGVAVVAPDIHPEELKVLHASGVRGIRLNLAGIDHEIPEWTRAEPVWQSLHDLGWHLEVHTDQGALPQVLAQLPSDMPLVVDHMAKPHLASTTDASVLALIKRAQRVPTYVKLSGAYRLGGVDASLLARLWLQELGPEALLWGSDWPCTNHENLANYAALMNELVNWLAGDHLDLVLTLNPQRLYWGNATTQQSAEE